MYYTRIRKSTLLPKRTINTNKEDFPTRVQIRKVDR